MLSLNSIIYPRPQSSYDKQTFHQQEHVQLIYCKPRHTKNTHEIPCLHIKSHSDQYLLYFHGNAEDIGSAYEFLFQIHFRLQINVIAVEYPGYGIYQSKQPSQAQLEEDAQSVYIYLQLSLKVPESKLIVLGRSIGTGPACFIASIYNPKALILMSPFTSIRAIAKSHVNFIAFLMKDQFDNLNKAPSISCPTLVIHGKQDQLIPYEQGDQVYKALGSKRKSFSYPETMNHNDFHYFWDLEKPIKDFLELLEQLDVEFKFVQPNI